MRISPARACAYAVLRRVFEAGAWADRALHGEATRHGLDPRDRALAMQLSYGATQRRGTLDHLIAQLSGRPVEQLDPPVRAALRLGLFQLCFLDRVPAHAAVGEAVELAKRDAPRGARLVNAVLRRATREGAALVEGLADATPAQAAVRHSHPAWVVDTWWELLGADATRALMAADNAQPEQALRVNSLRTGRDELAARLPVSVRTVAELPEALILEGPFDAFSAPEWEAGHFMPQSRAAMAVARVLAPAPGDRVLDLCAAPGGKTTHLAALMRDEGEIHAVESHAGRADALRRTARRMGASCVSVRVGDAREPQPDGAYDRVLVDPPCSDLGTLASRPDARWRKSAAQVQRLAAQQDAILRAGADALKRGGTLVYSTCTISPAENERVVERFLAGRDDFELDDLQSELPVWEHPRMSDVIQTLPHRDGTDGFFIARLRRTARP